MGELAFGEATYEGSLSTLGVLLATFLDETGPNTKQQRRIARWGVGAAFWELPSSMQTMRTQHPQGPEAEVSDITRICASVNYMSTHRVVVQTLPVPPNPQAQCFGAGVRSERISKRSDV